VTETLKTNITINTYIELQSLNILSERSSTMNITHTWWWAWRNSGRVWRSSGRVWRRSGRVWRRSGWFSRPATLTYCRNNSMNIISIYHSASMKSKLV